MCQSKHRNQMLMFLKTRASLLYIHVGGCVRNGVGGMTSSATSSRFLGIQFSIYRRLSPRITILGANTVQISPKHVWMWRWVGIYLTFA